MSNNPFNIRDNEPKKKETKKSNAPKYTGQKKYPKTAYTKEQIRKLLTGYIEVPHNKWADIPLSSHIRYLKKDGTFVRGGFVTNHWLNKEGKPFIHVANNFKKNAPGYKTWPMAHENVAKVFKKPDAKNGIEMEVVRSKTAEIIGQINRIVDAVKDVKKDVKRNEDDIKKMFALLKKIAAQRK
jgi:hypothetical protein